MAHVEAFALAGTAAALIGAGEAAAAFSGLECEFVCEPEWIANGYDCLKTFRLYARFDDVDPDDGVIAVFGSPSSPMQVKSALGVFHNTTAPLPFPPFGVPNAMHAPQDLTPFYWDNQWDTFITIGATNADDDVTHTSPGFDEAVDFLAGDFVVTDGNWFITPDDPQGLPTPDGRVLLAQFTFPVSSSYGVQGTVNLVLRDGTQIEGLFFGCLTKTPALPGDANGDFVVDFADLLFLFERWGDGRCFGDLDGNGEIGFGDVLLVLEHWGASW